MINVKCSKSFNIVPNHSSSVIPFIESVFAFILEGFSSILLPYVAVQKIALYQKVRTLRAIFDVTAFRGFSVIFG